MTAKEWLMRARRLDAEIGALIEEQKRAWDRAVSAAAGCTDDKVQTSRTNTSEARFVCYADYARRIDRRIDELYAVKCEIMDAIARVEDGTLRTLLIERYINFKTWENIAERLGMTEEWIRKRLHRKALEKIDQTRNQFPA